MTPNEAINVLDEVKTIDDSMFQYSTAYMKALDMAIDALKKQVPMKPEWKPELTQKHMNIGVKAPFCHICGADLLDDINDCHEFCPRCGQKILWESDDDTRDN